MTEDIRRDGDCLQPINLQRTFALRNGEYVDRCRDMIQNASMVLTQLEIPVDIVQHVADLCFQYNVPLCLTRRLRRRYRAPS